MDLKDFFRWLSWYDGPELPRLITFLTSPKKIIAWWKRGMKSYLLVAGVIIILYSILYQSIEGFFTALLLLVIPCAWYRQDTVSGKYKPKK